MAKKDQAKESSSKQDSQAKVSRPTRRVCHTMASYFEMVERFPEIHRKQAELAGFTRTYMQSGRVAERTGIFTIPIVVHVVYRTDEENISDEQIMSQIEVLNQDFQSTNPDLNNVPDAFKNYIGNPRIRFQLVDKDPNGGATNGITRTKTDETSFIYYGNPVKFSETGGVDAWDTREHLNIWVCTLGGSLLGYAQFPDGGPRETDGVVILNTAFGTTGTASAPYDKGRTATHEVGHYLGLKHIWGEEREDTCSDSDDIDDTPNQFGPNYGTPTYPSPSCNNTSDMFMNYMDYVDDEAMFMFTKQQVAKMSAILEGPRRSLVS